MFDITGADKPTLETVHQQFAQWRENRCKREPIPPHLWEAAANLCRTYPITRVCRHLHLSFAEVKKRVIKTQKPPVQFMDIGLSCLSGSWQLQCDRADGATLRLSASGQPPAVSDVLRVFLS